MGFAKLDFDPRICLKDFIDNKSKLNLIRRVKGRKSSENMLIWGENLASLAALKAGSGTTGEAMSVDVILIDPPYNVGGNQGYKNIWKGKSEKERHWAGDHGEFLDFMEPRLKIGRSLLADHGVMFVNICDGEYPRLKILMDQIFGEQNDLGTFIWNKKQGSPASHMTAVHEYVICFAKDKSKALEFSEIKPSAKMMLEKADTLVSKYGYEEGLKEYKKWIRESKKQGMIGSGEAQYNMIHPENNRVFMSDNTCAQDDPKGKRCRKKLKHPKTGKFSPVPKNGWKWKEETLDKLVSEGKIWFGKDHNVMPRIIRYLDEQMTHLPSTMITIPSTGKNDLPEGIEFTTPKPVSFNKHLLSLIGKKNITVLDYFAGSGATGHAVHELNKEDGGSRNWIMIEEMGSTFHSVLLPRCEYFDEKKDFSIFELKEVGVKSEQLFEVFEQYSFDFLSAYHTLDEEVLMSIEGMNILGYDKKQDQIVAMTMPQNREDDYFFEEELAVLKESLKKSGAKKVLIYSLTQKSSAQEPWLGVDKSILTGTKCKKLQIVEIPDQLVDEWNEVLTAMAA